MAPTTPADIFADVANAIREKDPTAPASIPVQNLAVRIQALPTPPPTGFSNNNRVYRFNDFLPPDVAQASKMRLLNGSPLRQGVDDQQLFDTFKSDFANQFSEIWSGSYNSPASELAMNRYLYVGGPATSILKIDTLTNDTLEITGLVNAGNVFQPIGRKCWALRSGVQVSEVLCIDVLDDTWQMFRIFSALSPTIMYLVPNTGLDANGRNAAPEVAWRIFYSNPSGYIYTYMASIELDANGVFIRTRSWWTSSSSTTHANMHVEGYKLFGFINGNIVCLNTATLGVPRVPVASGSINWGSTGGRYLYNGGNGQINRIDLETPPVWNSDWQQWEYPMDVLQITGLPSRVYSGFVFDAARDKLFVGTNTAGQAQVLRLRASNPSQRLDIAVETAAPSILRRIGDKIYLLPTTSVASSVLSAVDMENDAGIDITLPTSRLYNQFFLNGTTLYVLATGTAATAATAITIINTLNDQASEITGLGTSRALSSIVELDGRLYVGSSAGSLLLDAGYAGANLADSVISVINAANNTLFENITVPSNLLTGPSRSIITTANMRVINGVIYIFGTSLTPDSQSRIIALCQSMLPGRRFPRLPIYIRYGG